MGFLFARYACENLYLPFGWARSGSPPHSLRPRIFATTYLSDQALRYENDLRSNTHSTANYMPYITQQSEARPDTLYAHDAGTFPPEGQTVLSLNRDVAFHVTREKENLTWSTKGAHLRSRAGPMTTWSRRTTPRGEHADAPRIVFRVHVSGATRPVTLSHTMHGKHTLRLRYGSSPEGQEALSPRICDGPKATHHTPSTWDRYC